MDFQTLARISTLFAKSFAEELMRLLVTYRDISASEAASRLNLHIKTAQDFLEELATLDIAEKTEVYERKRPYFRYALKKKKLSLQVDFSALHDPQIADSLLSRKIRERKNAGALFTTASNSAAITTVSVFQGEGRKRKARKISLTRAQGKFLFHLPFPNAATRSIHDIIKQAGVDADTIAEVLDIVAVLSEFKVIEFAK